LKSWAAIRITTVVKCQENTKGFAGIGRGQAISLPELALSNLQYHENNHNSINKLPKGFHILTEPLKPKDRK
jgi:hypothetical protein